VILFATPDFASHAAALHKSVSGLDTGEFRAGVIVLAIRKPDGKMLFNPPEGMLVSEGDVLIVTGEQPSLRNLETVLSEAGVPR
jgi:uncharacterized protein with PhoU and TrkA domain